MTLPCTTCGRSPVVVWWSILPGPDGPITDACWKCVCGANGRRTLITIEVDPALL